MPRRSLLAAAALLGLCASGCPPFVAISIMAAAQPYYTSGDLHRAYNAKHAYASIDCLEIAPSLRQGERGTILEWNMGNGCNEPVHINLAKLGVVGTAEGGARGAMKLFDPADEIRELALPARRLVYEPIELTADFAPTRICLDLDRLDVGAPTPPGEICFVFEGREWETDRGGGS